GEYISRIYAEVKNRPKYIVASEHSRIKQEKSITKPENTFSSF
ncbi:glycosyltransferase, partial [Acinetobacter baumannii]